MTASSLKSRLAHILFEGLWLEGLRLFVQYWKNWTIGAIGLVGLQLYLDLYAAHFDKDIFYIAGRSITEGVTICFFCICFLNQEPITGSLKPGWRVFATGLVYYAFIQAIPIIAVFVTMRMDTAAKFFSIYVTTSAVMQFIVAMTSLLLSVIVTVGSVCTIPFAMSGLPHPWLRSFRVIRGHLWIVVFNLAVLLIIVAPVVTALSHVFPVVGGAISAVIIQGLSAAFDCAAARMLNGDYIAAGLAADRRETSRNSA